MYLEQPYNASMNTIWYTLVCDPESTKPGVHVTVVSVEQHSDMPFDLSLLVDAAAPQRLHCEVLYLHDWGEVHFPSQIQIVNLCYNAVFGVHDIEPHYK